MTSVVLVDAGRSAVIPDDSGICGPPAGTTEDVITALLHRVCLDPSELGAVFLADPRHPSAGTATGRIGLPLGAPRFDRSAAGAGGALGVVRAVRAIEKDPALVAVVAAADGAGFPVLDGRLTGHGGGVTGQKGGCPTDQGGIVGDQGGGIVGASGGGVAGRRLGCAADPGELLGAGERGGCGAERGCVEGCGGGGVSGPGGGGAAGRRFGGVVGPRERIGVGGSGGCGAHRAGPDGRGIGVDGDGDGRVYGRGGCDGDGCRDVDAATWDRVLGMGYRRACGSIAPEAMADWARSSYTRAGECSAAGDFADEIICATDGFRSDCFRKPDAIDAFRGGARVATTATHGLSAAGPIVTAHRARGASAVVLASESTAIELGLGFRARIRVNCAGSASVGPFASSTGTDFASLGADALASLGADDAASFGAGAVNELLAPCGVDIDGLDQLEVPEQCAAVPPALIEQTGISEYLVNPRGGDLAFGLLPGSGRLRALVTMINSLECTGGRVGALLAGEGGRAAVLVLTRDDTLRS